MKLVKLNVIKIKKGELMVVLILFLLLSASFNLVAPQAVLPSSQRPPEGYVMVPESKLKEVLNPPSSTDLKELTNNALAAKQEALGIRSDITSSLSSFKKSVNDLRDAQNMQKQVQKMIDDRIQAKENQATKLQNVIKKAQDTVDKARASISQINDNTKKLLAQQQPKPKPTGGDTTTPVSVAEIDRMARERQKNCF